MLTDVTSALSELGASCKATPRIQFDSPHFIGSSFNLECHSNVAQQAALQAIRNLGSVGKAWPVRKVKAQRNIPQDGSTNLELPPANPPFGRLGGVASSHSPNLVARESIFPDTLSTHVETGIDRLHAEGITGKGIRIAVVDSSFDTSVPGLRGTAVGYTKDVIAGGSAVRDDCSYHGTHVLGIVGAAGAASAYGVSGAAHGATYELYRIQACGADAAQTDDLVAGLPGGGRARRRRPHLLVRRRRRVPRGAVGGGGGARRAERDVCLAVRRQPPARDGGRSPGTGPGWRWTSWWSGRRTIP